MMKRHFIEDSFYLSLLKNFRTAFLVNKKYHFIKVTFKFSDSTDFKFDDYVFYYKLGSYEYNGVDFPICDLLTEDVIIDLFVYQFIHKGFKHVNTIFNEEIGKCCGHGDYFNFAYYTFIYYRN